VGAVNLVARKHIIRGFRIRYIPGLNGECEELYKEFQGKENYNTADKLLISLNTIRKQRW